jgi:hypothetical protein
MSISEPVEHLYSIDKRGERVVVSFLTKREGYFIPIVFALVLCFVLVKTGIHRNWNQYLVSGIIGASISLVATTCFAMFERITRYVIAIDPELVSFQRTLEGVPVGRRRVYSRHLVTDLGVYPIIRTHGGMDFPLGRLCLWAGSKSIQIENYFPIREGAELAYDLRRMGIEFPRTYLRYDKDRPIYSDDYLSF